MKLSAIISSVKPFKDDQYTAYQKAAISSWLPLCHNVVLFNHRADVGDLTPIVLIEPQSNPPTLKEMLARSVNRVGPDGVIALVNSDIILGDAIIKCLDVAQDRGLGRVWGATSFRFEGDPPEVKGQGLDVFVLSVGLVQHILRDIPDFLTIGRPLWDNWLNGWLRMSMRSSHYFDMTPWRCVFHPEHERPNGVGGSLVRYTDAQVAEAFAKINGQITGIPPTKYL